MISAETRALLGLVRPVRPSNVAPQSRRRFLRLGCQWRQPAPLDRRPVALRQHDCLRRVPRKRTAATATATKSRTEGPLAEYDRRVQAGRLQDDTHQRSVVESLQALHDELKNYNPPEVAMPSVESTLPKKKGLFGSIFGGGDDASKLSMEPRDDVPKGLYMYGDVGSGKTMLMDLFYDTLPQSTQRKTRIHFHDFMQNVHKDVHKFKMEYGGNVDAIPFVAAKIARQATVLCFDEFQCTDVADAMILRRLIESLLAHGTVLVATSNRHPNDLYKMGIQRESFIPAINLLIKYLRVINLDSQTDYRRILRKSLDVFYYPLDESSKEHAEEWFRFFGDFERDPPHPATHEVWGRQILVPKASDKACWFEFDELMGRNTGAADYLELARAYDAFIVVNVPGMNIRSRDLARRFITFIDAIYEARSKLVLTTAVPLTELFMAKDKVADALKSNGAKDADHNADVSDAMRNLMDDLGMSMETLKGSSIFTGDEEAFAFARALSRLSEMGSQEWIQRGLSEGKIRQMPETPDR
ncbi:AFG1-like ATPase [Piedraia hortae CBS 480.64]|uniref:AFG1-like ATPase n=1 Tax=Piedraia hortae CBS 480.64 TaxID=1314780 RepID=A0A6A7CAM2_9PEZI|nr:AFG1-like ATPase [Piedraia hortae CBS 480.64]